MKLIIIFISLLSVNQLKSQKIDTLYFDNTDVIKEIISKNEAGIRDGSFSSFYENGSLKLKESYVDGWLEGLSTRYYESGIIKVKGSYKGESWFLNRIGTWREFDDKGRITYSCDYLKGKMDGDLKYYYPNGQISSLIQYSNNQAEGNSTTYFENGKIRIKGSYLNGQKNGTWIEYFPTGEVESSGVYENDSINGVYVYYYKNGNIRVSLDYAFQTITKLDSNGVVVSVTKME